MNVLMFGWEFPPMKSGGLGTACYDLCKGLSRLGNKVTFVVPRLGSGMNSDVAQLMGANEYFALEAIDSPLRGYMTTSSYEQTIESLKRLDGGIGENYGKHLFAEIERYARAASVIVKRSSFEVIHAHDWMTYEAAMIAKSISGKPFVAHIHATEFDRTGGNPNHEISHREYEGLHAADLIIANSEFTKQNVMHHYKISGDKIRVVHWGIDQDNPHYDDGMVSPFADQKTVLFLGRVTLQKGPDYFVKVAKEVEKHVPNTTFVFAGSGDMLPRIIDEVHKQDMAHKFVFTGFLRGKDVHHAFQMADLYVMPSVSEPFGLVALESMRNGTPVLMSKQSGVSEVVSHAYKVDFWDIQDMTNKIVAHLEYPALSSEIKKNAYQESKTFTLEVPAEKCIDCYKEVLGW